MVNYRFLNDRLGTAEVPLTVLHSASLSPPTQIDPSSSYHPNQYNHVDQKNEDRIISLCCNDDLTSPSRSGPITCRTRRAANVEMEHSPPGRGLPWKNDYDHEYVDDADMSCCGRFSPSSIGSGELSPSPEANTRSPYLSMSFLFLTVSWCVERLIYDVCRPNRSLYILIISCAPRSLYGLLAYQKPNAYKANKLCELFKHMLIHSGCCFIVAPHKHANRDPGWCTRLLLPASAKTHSYTAISASKLL